MGSVSFRRRAMSVRSDWMQGRASSSHSTQKRVFQHCVLQRCAQAGDKIITVHSIRSAKAVLDHVEAYHWLGGARSSSTGSPAQERSQARALDLGLLLD